MAGKEQILFADNLDDGKKIKCMYWHFSLFYNHFLSIKKDQIVKATNLKMLLKL